MSYIPSYVVSTRHRLPYGPEKLCIPLFNLICAAFRQDTYFIAKARLNGEPRNLLHFFYKYRLRGLKAWLYGESNFRASTDVRDVIKHMLSHLFAEAIPTEPHLIEDVFNLELRVHYQQIGQLKMRLRLNPYARV
ncbi:hypothetical protein [Ruegeria sp. HKCCD6604]|uniref:hypothetical protein n=1 Tax=Ruegeria sp. HKCCD6604 TaxID=2683000 RepID=UPI00149268F5|nr:hypothetical protein [Ruegeria sp. HKCCD6604]NOC93874.1 hypothetical protein [Ruegeria sp. HKCCD6604]